MKTKKYLTILYIVLFQLLAVNGFACDISFYLTDPNGNLKDIYPGDVIALENGSTYTLKIVFIEDHGQCKLGADETEFLLDDEKWKVNKDYLPLQLLGNISWQQTASKKHETSITFQAQKEGTFDLEIIRDCSKGGYDEILTFRIS